MRDWKLKISKKWEGTFRRSVPNGKKGLPLEEVHDFRKYFPEISVTFDS